MRADNKTSDARCMFGAASVKVQRPGAGLGDFGGCSQSSSLAELLFTAACGETLKPGSLDFNCKVGLRFRSLFSPIG